MPAGDFRDRLQAAVPVTARLAALRLAALRLVQPAEQHLELPMILAIRMITRPTRRTTTLANRTFRDHHQPNSVRHEICALILHGSDACQADRRRRSWRANQS